MRVIRSRLLTAGSPSRAAVSCPLLTLPRGGTRRPGSPQDGFAALGEVSLFSNPPAGARLCLPGTSGSVGSFFLPFGSPCAEWGLLGELLLCGFPDIESEMSSSLGHGPRSVPGSSLQMFVVAAGEMTGEDAGKLPPR